jgi:hypothetical protein
VIIGRAERWDEDTHAAVAEAVAGLVSSAPDIESAERALLDDGPVALMVLDALRRTRAREWLTRWWSRIWTRLEPQLSAAQDRFPAPGPTVVDRWCTFEVADALADLGDMSALHTLAELGRETLAHADPSEPSTMSTRRLLARRAVLLLARRHDLELLAKLPPMDERNNVVRAAFEDVCRGDIGVSRWAATNSDEREAGYAVTQAAGTDAACRALARAWVADPNAADWRRCKSAEALLRGDITREDETALVGWFDEDGNRASWVSSALGTSSKRVHEAAIGWIERWLDGRVSLGATSTPATARAPRARRSCS